MAIPKIEIKSKSENGSIFTEIYVDGHKLTGVRKFELKHGVGNELPTLTVDLNALKLSVDTEAILIQEGIGEIDINFKDFPKKALN